LILFFFVGAGDAQMLLPVGFEVGGLYVATTGAEVPNPNEWWPKTYSGTCVIAQATSDAACDYSLWKVLPTAPYPPNSTPTCSIHTSAGASFG
jgi:hypothetical protein